MKNGATVARGIAWGVVVFGYIRAIRGDEVWVDFEGSTEMETGWYHSQAVTPIQDWFPHKEKFYCN